MFGLVTIVTLKCGALAMCTLNYKILQSTSKLRLICNVHVTDQ